MPSESLLEQWAGQVPDGFAFVLKASQRITHMRRLKPEAAEPLDILLRVSAVLGAARGPLLFQLPPNFRKDIDRLRDFLVLIPGDVRAAFEFRHPSWFEDDTYDVLRDHGVALCVADSPEETTPLVATAGWGYLRLRSEAYEEDDLSTWVRSIREQAWSDVFVFFKHEDAGTGPALARRFEVSFNTS